MGFIKEELLNLEATGRIELPNRSFADSRLNHLATSPNTKLVPRGRLELPRVAPLPPQDSVSANSTTSATFNQVGSLQVLPANGREYDTAAEKVFKAFIHFKIGEKINRIAT